MSYSIKEVADMMNVSTATLRYYDAEGLIPDIKRVGGRRVFEDTDLRWLKILLCMKDINMPIKKIREYVELVKLGDASLEKRYNMFVNQKKIIEDQIEELKDCLKVFEFKEEYYSKAIKAGTEKAVEGMLEYAPILGKINQPEKNK